ncbi:MAG TPA: DEAD/DEAH box helicase [Solirubrobacteraceae bacterium]
MSTQSFADLGVSKAVSDALSRRGFTHPFAVQSLVIGDVLAGRDVLVKSPTGSGKTLAFGIPTADLLDANGPRPAALVLAPTRELATQIAEELQPVVHARALRIAPVYGGVGIAKQSAIAARSHIIVATPGRLEDLLARKAFDLSAIRILVLDEADRMLDMGFRPAVDRIVRACPRSRQTLFFSATLDGMAGDVAAAYTTDAIIHEHNPSGGRTAREIEHRFVQVAGDRRVEALVDELAADRDLALVFVRTKRGADRLVKQLDGHGVAAASIHGNKSQSQREQALARFESGRVDTLVATDVAARGIDVRGISHVINFHLPDDHEAYVHRVGRTGRAGRQGVGITLVASAERNDARQLAKKLGLAHSLGAAESPGNRERRSGAPAARSKAKGPRSAANAETPRAGNGQRRSRRRNKAQTARV